MEASDDPSRVSDRLEAGVIHGGRFSWWLISAGSPIAT